MRYLFFTLLLFVSSLSYAGGKSLLSRALSCEINDAEVPTLLKDIRSETTGMKVPEAYLAAPSGDLYHLNEPVSVFGLSSTAILVMSARILMAVPQTTLSHITKNLQLETIPFSPSSRSVRPSVSIIAFELHQKELEGKVLVGCEYALPSAAEWIGTH
jgi:hypothetical protein